MIKKFKSHNMGIITTGCQAKGVSTEYDGKGSKKTYYIKTENYFTEAYRDTKLDFSGNITNTSNMILYECLTSKIFQKLGIDTIPYHFGKVINSDNPWMYLPAIYSESFVDDNENQFPLTEVFRFFKINKDQDGKLPPSAIVKGEEWGSKMRQNYNQPYTYVDENIMLLQSFFARYQTIYPGGINIDYDTIKTQLIKQLIGDLLCYNGDRHSGNVVFVSKVKYGANGRECNIRLAPAFDFGYTFFAERSQDELKNLIEAKTIPYLMDKKMIYCMSLTNYNNYSGHNDFYLLHDYIKLLYNKSNATPYEKEVLGIIENVNKINIRECFRELFVEELDDANNAMSLDQLIDLYNKQMEKNIDLTTIQNVENLFNYSKNLLLNGHPTHNGNYTNLLKQRSFNISTYLPTHNNDDNQKSEFCVNNSKAVIKKSESAMGDDEG